MFKLKKIIKKPQLGLHRGGEAAFFTSDTFDFLCIMKNTQISRMNSKILFLYAINSAVAVHTAVGSKFLYRSSCGAPYKTLLLAAFQMFGV